jgi:hypothetical protein
MKSGEFLGEYTITPNTVSISVDCYGTVDPAQHETLEQDGFGEHATVERVEHNGYDITDYLSDDVLHWLNEQANDFKNH